MQVIRVTAEPAELVSNTTYLVGPANSTDLQIVVVGTTNAEVRRSVTQAQVTSQIATALAGAGTSPVYAADIDARDALALDRNTFVLVADASADADVDAGAALYFYLHDSTTFIRVAEYESMDLVIPNKTILEDLSDIDGHLCYKGAPVSTFEEGVHQW